MSFYNKQTINGVSGDSLGSFSTLSGFYFASGAGDNESVNFYKMNYSGTWEFIYERPLNGFYLKSIDSFKNYCAYGCSEDPIGTSSKIVIVDFKDLYDVFSVEKSSSISFGNSISICENFIAVGDPYFNNTGSVYVYRKTNGAFDESTEFVIEADFPSNNQYFGYSVSVSNEFLVVGAIGDSNDRGCVYVYEYNSSNGEWDLNSKIYSSDGKENDKFGYAVSLSGEYLAVSAPYYDIDDEITDAGAVYIYKYSEGWYEIDKKNINGEEILSNNRFGEVLVLKNDYLLVGSPNARTAQGVVDIFYKKRNWEQIDKIFDENGSVNDSFGKSLSVDERYVIVGSPNKDVNGSIIFFEDPPILFKAAQEFSANNVFIPSKISVSLDVVGKNESDSWILSNEYYTVIDSTNFSNIEKKEHKIIIDDSYMDFTGNGYMTVLEYPEAPDFSIQNMSGINLNSGFIEVNNEYYNSILSNERDFSILEYPIRSIEDCSYYLWIRYNSFESDIFQADILIDGNVVSSIDENVDSSLEWKWVYVKIIIPDTENHILGIKLKQFGNAIDKIYIDSLYDEPYLYGYSYSNSPYITCHFQIYDNVHNSPNLPLSIYDYKTSIDSFKTKDWYNFDSKVIVPFINEYSMHFSERSYNDIGKEEELSGVFADTLSFFNNFETIEQFNNMVSSLKSINPGILLPLGTSSCICYQNSEQNGDLFKFYIEESDVYDDWFLKDENGDRVQYDSSGNKWYIDLRNFDARQALIRHNFKQAQEYGFNVMKFYDLFYSLSDSELFSYGVTNLEWTNACIQFAKESRNFAINNGMLSYVDVDVYNISDVPSMIDSFSSSSDGIFNKYGFNNESLESLNLEYESYERALLKGKRIFVYCDGEYEDDALIWLRPLFIKYYNIFVSSYNNEDADNDLFHVSVLRNSIYEDFYGSYYIALSATGETDSHYIVWETKNIINKNLSSAFRF